MKSRFATVAMLFVLSVMPVLTHAQSSGQSYMSLDKFLELEQVAIDKSSGSPVVTIYLGGVIESLDMANAYLERQKSKPLFCPLRETLSAKGMRILLGSYIAKTRLIMSKSDFDAFQKTMNVGAISLIALQDNFPCK